jgi:hypothetical protein
VRAQNLILCNNAPNVFFRWAVEASTGLDLWLLSIKGKWLKKRKSLPESKDKQMVNCFSKMISLKGVFRNSFFKLNLVKSIHDFLFWTQAKFGAFLVTFNWSGK